MLLKTSKLWHTVKPVLVTTSIQRPLGHAPAVFIPCILTSIKRPPLFKDSFFLAQPWSLNAGFYCTSYTIYDMSTQWFWCYCRQWPWYISTPAMYCTRAYKKIARSRAPHIWTPEGHEMIKASPIIGEGGRRWRSSIPLRYQHLGHLVCGSIDAAILLRHYQVTHSYGMFMHTLAVERYISQGPSLHASCIAGDSL